MFANYNNRGTPVNYDFISNHISNYFDYNYIVVWRVEMGAPHSLSNQLERVQAWRRTFNWCRFTTIGPSEKIPKNDPVFQKRTQSCDRPTFEKAPLRNYKVTGSRKAWISWFLHLTFWTSLSRIDHTQVAQNNFLNFTHQRFQANTQMIFDQTS